MAVSSDIAYPRTKKLPDVPDVPKSVAVISTKNILPTLLLAGVKLAYLYCPFGPDELKFSGASITFSSYPVVEL
jgi:hypothetical protein